MEIHELVVEMKLLERRLKLYEEKYETLSEDFYNALMAGKAEFHSLFNSSGFRLTRMISVGSGAGCLIEGVPE